MFNIAKILFPGAYKTKRKEIIKALDLDIFRPVEGEELYTVIVYMGEVKTKDGQTILIQDAIVKSPENVDANELWNSNDRGLVHDLTMAGYGEHRPIHCTPYYAYLEGLWGMGMDANKEGVLKIFPEGMKKQKCEIMSVIVEFHFSMSQLMLLLKLKDCSDTLYNWAM